MIIIITIITTIIIITIITIIIIKDTFIIHMGNYSRNKIITQIITLRIKWNLNMLIRFNNQHRITCIILQINVLIIFTS